VRRTAEMSHCGIAAGGSSGIAAGTSSGIAAGALLRRAPGRAAAQPRAGAQPKASFGRMLSPMRSIERPTARPPSEV